VQLETELGQLRAKLGADKQEALLALKRELEEKMVLMKTDFMAKVDKLVSELKAKAVDHERVVASKDAEIKELADRLASTELSLTGQLGGQEAKANLLSKEISNLRESLSSVTAKLAQREQEITSLQAMLNEKNASITRLDVDLKSANQEIDRLKMEMDFLYKSGAGMEQELKNKLNVSLNEAESLRAEINQMGAALASVREEIKKSEKVATKAAQDAEKTISSISLERDALARRLQDMMKTNSDSNDVAIAEINSLRKKITEREEESSKEKNLVKETHEKSIMELRDMHKVELDSVLSAKQSLLDKLAAKESESADLSRSQKEMYELKIDQIGKNHKSEVDELTNQHNEEVGKLKSSLLGLEVQIQTQADQSEIEKSALRNEANKLDNKAKSIQVQLYFL
jgi:chromosome segregation ATPase